VGQDCALPSSELERRSLRQGMDGCLCRTRGFPITHRKVAMRSQHRRASPFCIGTALGFSEPVSIESRANLPITPLPITPHRPVLFLQSVHGALHSFHLRRDPYECMLMYLSLGKKAVLLSLFRQVCFFSFGGRAHRACPSKRPAPPPPPPNTHMRTHTHTQTHPCAQASNKKIVDFLSRDFSNEANRHAASKNAFALLGQHRRALPHPLDLDLSPPPHIPCARSPWALAQLIGRPQTRLAMCSPARDIFC
jgi:hypothetical protein